MEIGFGIGHILVRLAKPVGEKGQVHGIKLSEEMHKLFEKLLQKQGLSGRVKLSGDAVDLPYPDGSLYAIFMSFTLELFDSAEIPKVLGECKRVLKPQVRIMVAGMSKEGKERPYVRAFEWMHRYFTNFLDCRPIYVRQAFEDAAFAIESAALTHMCSG